jgi:hypothetical protein
VTRPRRADHPDPHVDYGTIDLDDPSIQVALEQDHRNDVHHYGLPCCEPEAKR